MAMAGRRDGRDRRFAGGVLPGGLRITNFGNRRGEIAKVCLQL
jgi:hypothetical protein